MTEAEHAQAWGSDEGRSLLCKLLKDDSLGLLMIVPARFHTPKVLAAAGQHSALSNFKFIPDKYKSPELCRAALTNSLWARSVLCHVPTSLRDRSLCAFALHRAVSDPFNTFRTEQFKNQLNDWYLGWMEGDSAASASASARAHLSSFFVESEFPDRVWDLELVKRSMASSPYAVLFIPRRHVTVEALVQVLRDHFATYLLLESDVACELAPQAAQILRDFVGERAWHLGAQWQALNEMLGLSEQASLLEALGLHAIRWLQNQPYIRIMAETMEGGPPLSTLLVESILASRQHATQIFPGFVGRHALSREDIHRVCFVCEKISA